MKVAFLASEAIPYAKTGGLADVAGALPKFLSRLGADVRVFMPFYREVRKKGLPLVPAVARGAFEWGGRTADYAVMEHRADGFLVDFIVRDAYFDRDALYGTPAGDYPDNGERFAFFARASLEAMKALGFAPDVVHGHDWQSATAFAYLKFVYAGDPFFADTRSVFTVHNLAYQGLFERDVLPAVGLPDSLFNMNDLEFYGKVNFLKAGILYASAVTTVSPRYSREIQTPEFGCGMDGLLRARSDALTGILNGVDYADWDPATDRLIPAELHAPRPDRQGPLEGRPARDVRARGRPEHPGRRDGHASGRPEGRRHRLRGPRRDLRPRPDRRHPRHGRPEDPGLPQGRRRRDTPAGSA